MSAYKFGLFSISGDLDEVLDRARWADERGFYSISPNDHFFSPFGGPEAPQLECFTLMTAIAGVTERLRLVPAVVAASFRPPPLLAKIATTLDLVSKGRLILGLGSGWFPEEYHAHGYPFPPTPERLDQLEEAIRVVKAMWCDPEPTFEGRYFRIEKALNRPRPFQKPHPPILLGGSGTRLLRIAARHGDLVNLIPPTGNGKDFPKDPEATLKFDMKRLHERIERLRRFAVEAGRDPDTIELSGLAFLGISRDGGAPWLAELAGSLGFPDLASAKRSPVVLFGTPEEVCEEIERRAAETGIRYTILAPASPDSLELFSEEVMPEFATA